ncbi:MAG: methylmalonyl-CoA mutase family protein [Flavobacteriales bacterium]
MKKELDFQDFKATDFDTWKSRVMKELGEKPYESLIWNIGDGIEVPPYFTSYQPRFQRFEKSIKEWGSGQRINFSSEKETNQIMLNSLMGGANHLSISFENNEKINFKTLFENVHLDYISVHFDGKGIHANFMNDFAAFMMNENVAIENTSGSFNSASADKISDTELKVRSEVFFQLKKKWRVFGVNATKIHKKGGSIVQCLTYAVAETNEWIQKLTSQKLLVDDISAMIACYFETSSSYFPEIAKYRAFRTLYANVISAYSPVHSCTLNPYVVASTSTYLQTTLDIHNNLLRNTSQAMSAIIGNVDVSIVSSYNSLLESNDEDALRWSRNIMHLLREESYFCELEDVSKGSFYIEYLTDELAEKSWEMFQWIEDLGGLNKAWDAFDEKVHLSKQMLEESIDFGDKVIVGVNKFVDKLQLKKEVSLKNENYLVACVESALRGGQDEN